MAINLTELAQKANKANILSSLILVTPGQNIGYQPQNPETKDGSVDAPPRKILFHYEGEQTVGLESNITDHFVEDNTAVQDHISLQSEMISTHGFIGELNNVVPTPLIPLKIIADKLAPLGGYFPELSVTALRAFQQAQFAYQNVRDTVNNVVEAISTLGGLAGDPAQTIQQTYFSLFHGYWRERRLFTVQTPWGIFQNMAIKSLKAVQDDETEVITDFEITFKAIRFTSSLGTTSVPADRASGRRASQISDEVFLGNSAPDISDFSLKNLGASIISGGRIL